MTIVVCVAFKNSTLRWPILAIWLSVLVKNVIMLGLVMLNSALAEESGL